MTRFFLLLRLPAILAGSALLLGTPALAQEVKSRPVGFLVESIPTGQARTLSIPFDADPSSLANTVGRLTAVGADYFEYDSAQWTPGAFSTASAPYFVRITSGEQAGRIFPVGATANTATRIYVLDDGVGLATLALESGATGAGFEIIPGDTLASFFGTTVGSDQLVVQGAATPIDADLVQVWGGATWLNFYYNTTWQRWARDTDVISDPSRDAFFLRPDRGIMITRRGTTALDLTVMGRVLVTPQRSFHSRTANALTFLSTMQTADATLGALALQSGSRSFAWSGGSDPTNADLLVVWGGAAWFSFFYNSTTGHWQRVGDATPSYDAFVLRVGTPVFVQRRQSGSTAVDKTINFPTPGL